MRSTHSMPKGTQHSPHYGSGFSCYLNDCRFLPSTAMAQLEEIVVTARARAESLQDVPSTVTAFTANQISDMGIQRAETSFLKHPELVSLIR